MRRTSARHFPFGGRGEGWGGGGNIRDMKKENDEKRWVSSLVHVVMNACMVTLADSTITIYIHISCSVGP